MNYVAKVRNPGANPIKIDDWRLTYCLGRFFVGLRGRADVWASSTGADGPRLPAAVTNTDGYLKLTKSSNRMDDKAKKLRVKKIGILRMSQRTCC